MDKPNWSLIIFLILSSKSRPKNEQQQVRWTTWTQRNETEPTTPATTPATSTLSNSRTYPTWWTQWAQWVQLAGPAHWDHLSYPTPVHPTHPNHSNPITLDSTKTSKFFYDLGANAAFPRNYEDLELADEEDHWDFELADKHNFTADIRDFELADGTDGTDTGDFHATNYTFASDIKWDEIKQPNHKGGITPWGALSCQCINPDRTRIISIGGRLKHFPIEHWQSKWRFWIQLKQWKQIHWRRQHHR